MKAWVSHGCNLIPDQAVKSLTLEEALPVPSPGLGQVRVHVHYAGADPVDWKLLGGDFRDRLPKSRLRFVPGLDASGVVVEVGTGCSRIHVGDHVVLCLGLQESFSEDADFGPAGAFAEFCVCPEEQVSKVPGNVNVPAESMLLKTAGLPLAGLTAYQALFTGGGSSTRGEALGSTAAGSQVLVLGGNRGAGHLAVQMAALRGADVSTTVPPSSVGWMKDLGAKQIVNFREEDWVERLAPGPGYLGFDLVLDCVGWATSRQELDRAARVLRPGGQYVIVSHAELFDELGSSERDGRFFKAVLPTVCVKDLDVLVDWVAAGHLKVFVDQVCPFHEVPHALHESVAGQCKGKVLICQCGAHRAGEPPACWRGPAVHQGGA